MCGPEGVCLCRAGWAGERCEVRIYMHVCVCARAYVLRDARTAALCGRNKRSTFMTSIMTRIDDDLDRR